MFGSNHRSYEGPVTIRIFSGVLAGEIAAVNNASSQSFLFRRNSRIQDGHADAAAVEANVFRFSKHGFFASRGLDVAKTFHRAVQRNITHGAVLSEFSDARSRHLDRQR